MNDDRKYWLDNPRNVTRICWALYVVCALLFLADESSSGYISGVNLTIDRGVKAARITGQL